MNTLVSALLLVFVVRATEATDADDAQPFLLVAVSVPGSYVGGKIYRVDPKTYVFDEIIMNDTLYWPIAIDYDPQEKRIYWSEGSSVVGRIQRSFLDGSGVETVFDAKAVSRSDGVVTGLAVDAVNRLIFYTDEPGQLIGKLTIPDFSRQTVIGSGLTSARAIVLHTKGKKIFWTDWGNDGKIEQAGYDGSGRTVVVSGLKAVYALALDAGKDRLYWVDAYTDRVECSDMEGSNRRLIFQGPSTYTFYGLALLQDTLYITDWEERGAESNTSQLLRMDMEGDLFNIRHLDSLRLNDIHAYTALQSSAPEASNVLSTAALTTTALVAVVIVFIVG